MARLTEGAVKRLEDARDRAQQLSDELSDPGTFSDPRRAADLGREQVELSSVVERYERYQGLLGQIEQAEELLGNGADEDMRALAQQEIDEVEPRVAEVIESLQEFLRPRDPNDQRDVILEI